jgi:hypothetical protein
MFKTSVMNSSVFLLLCLTLFASCGNSYDRDREVQASKEAKNLIEQKAIQVQPNHSHEYLYRIVSPEQWQESLLQNHVINSSIDKVYCRSGNDAGDRKNDWRLDKVRAPLSLPTQKGYILGFPGENKADIVVGIVIVVVDVEAGRRETSNNSLACADILP